MTLSSFFRRLWRVNAVLIFVGGVLAIGLLLFAVVEIGGEMLRPRSRQGVVDVGRHASEELVFTLGDFEQVAGAGVLRAPLRSKQDRLKVAGFGSSGGDTYLATRNHLFFDVGMKQAHWLTQGHDQVFLSTRELTFQREKTGRLTAVAIVYEVVSSDTNGDAQLTRADSLDLAISDPRGRRYAVLLKGIDRYLSDFVRQDQSLLLFYETSDEVRVAEVDPTLLKIVDDRPLSALPSAAE